MSLADHTSAKLTGKWMQSLAEHTIAKLTGTWMQVELVPGGSDMPVNNANRVEFIRLVSNYRLNTQLRVATEAFKRGFHHLIDPTWVSMFNGEELQKLISGGAKLGLDLADLQEHITYASGYAKDHPIIEVFWQVGALALQSSSFTHSTVQHTRTFSSIFLAVMISSALQRAMGPSIGFASRAPGGFLGFAPNCMPNLPGAAFNCLD